MPVIKLVFKPLTAERWADFEELFGKKGACGGCWCMLWRTTHATFERQKGSGNKRAMKRIVAAGNPPGIIAYSRSRPIGWCSVGPRTDFVRLENSRVLKPVDDRVVWSITCLFIDREFRNMGVSSRLIEAAVKYGSRKGARTIEAYPFDPRQGKQPDPFVWTGLLSAYQKVGFTEIARRSPTRPIVRREV